MCEIWCECLKPLYKGGSKCARCRKRLESYWWHRRFEPFWKDKPWRSRRRDS